MTTENPDQLLPPPDFGESDKTTTQPIDTPPEPPQPTVADTVGEAVISNVEATIPEPAAGDAAAGTESAETDEDEITFDLLIQLDKKNLKILLGKVSPTVLATSIAGMDTEAQDKVLGALSKAVADALRAEIGKLGTVSDDAVEEAQGEVVEIAENLDEEGTISLDALFEEESESVTQSSTQPLSPPAPTIVERQKTPEVRKAEALTDYFGVVESGTDFLRKIVDMPRSAALRTSIELSELEQLSGELSQKILDFFDLVDAWEKENKNRREIVESGEKFIVSAKIPSGCQGAFRTIMNFAVRQKLGPSVETLKAPLETKPDTSASKPPPAGGGTGETLPPSTPRTPLGAAEIVAYYKAGKAAAGIKTSSSASEGTAHTASPTKEEQESVEPPAEKLGYRSSRWWNPNRKSAPETAPATPATVPPAETATTPSVPTPESVPIPPVAAPAPKPETAPLAERTTTGWTPEKIAALTFEEALQVKPEYLKEVFRLINMDVVSAALTDMSPELVEKTRQSLTEEDKVRFDRLHSLELLNTQVVVDAARRKIVERVQAELKTSISSAEAEAPSIVSEKIGGGWTRERIEALTFEDLADLNDDDLRIVVQNPELGAWGFGIVIRGMPETFINRMRDIVGDADNFDRALEYPATVEDVRYGRERFVQTIKGELLKILQKENPPKS